MATRGLGALEAYAGIDVESRDTVVGSADTWGIGGAAGNRVCGPASTVAPSHSNCAGDSVEAMGSGGSTFRCADGSGHHADRMSGGRGGRT